MNLFELGVRDVAVALVVLCILFVVGREVAWHAGWVKRWKIGVYLRDPLEPRWYLAFERYGVVTRWSTFAMKRKIEEIWTRLIELNHDPRTTRVFAFTSRYAPSTYVDEDVAAQPDASEATPFGSEVAA